MVAEFPTPANGNGEPGQARVLGLASTGFFTNGTFDSNRDFIVNAFNWMAERDYRVRVSPRDPGVSFLDLRHGAALPVLGWTVRVVIPLASILVGAFFAWRRRS